MNRSSSEFLRVGVCALTLVGLWGCAASRADLRMRLEEPRPVERIRAAALIAEQGRTDLIPALVDRLDDADAAVRLYTILALEKLTGTRLGYDYAADVESRREAVARWRGSVASGQFRPTNATGEVQAAGEVVP